MFRELILLVSQIKEFVFKLLFSILCSNKFLIYYLELIQRCLATLDQ